MIGRLAPWRHPRTALAIWSHKLLRWATPWLVALVAAAGLALAAADSPAYFLAPLGVLAGVTAAITAHALVRAGRRPPKALAFARSFTVVCLAFAVGWINVVRGRGIDVWHRADWDIRVASRNE